MLNDENDKHARTQIEFIKSGNVLRKQAHRKRIEEGKKRDGHRICNV